MGDLRKKESNEVARNSSPGDRRKGCRAKGESKRAYFDAIEHQQPLCARIFSLNVFGVDRTPKATNVHKYSCTFALSFLLCSLLLELTCQESEHVATSERNRAVGPCSIGPKLEGLYKALVDCVNKTTRLRSTPRSTLHSSPRSQCAPESSGRLGLSTSSARPRAFSRPRAFYRFLI